MEVDALVSQNSGYTATSNATSTDSAAKHQEMNIDNKARQNDVSKVSSAKETSEKSDVSASEKNKDAEKEKPYLAMPSGKTLKKAVENANKALSPAMLKLDLSVHEKTNRIMIKVVDISNDEVIREVPPKESLDFLAKVLEQAGILVDKKG